MTPSPSNMSASNLFRHLFNVPLMSYGRPLSEYAFAGMTILLSANEGRR